MAANLRTPTPAANIISTTQDLPSKQRKLRRNGTDPLFIGYSFTEKKYNKETSRPQNLSINEEFDDDDTNNDVSIQDKSNIFDATQKIRFVDPKKLECEVSYPKKKKQSTNTSTNTSNISNTSSSLPVLQDRASISSDYSSNDNNNTNNAPLKRKKKLNVARKQRERKQCMFINT